MADRGTILNVGQVASEKLMQLRNGRTLGHDFEPIECVNIGPV